MKNLRFLSLVAAAMAVALASPLVTASARSTPEWAEPTPTRPTLQAGAAKNTDLGISPCVLIRESSQRRRYGCEVIEAEPLPWWRLPISFDLIEP